MSVEKVGVVRGGDRVEYGVPSHVPSLPPPLPSSHVQLTCFVLGH